MVTREQPYGMPTSMMSSMQTNPSTYAYNVNVYTPYNTQLRSGSSMPGKNALPLTT